MVFYIGTLSKIKCMQKKKLKQELIYILSNKILYLLVLKINKNYFFEQIDNCIYIFLTKVIIAYDLFLHSHQTYL